MRLKLRLNLPLLLSIFCWAFVALCVCDAASPQISTPSDSTLLTSFNAHRMEFERLRQMVTEDMHQISFFSEATITNVRADARRNEYRRLLRLSPNLEVGTDYNGTVRFIFASSETLAVGSGWAKGIEFIPESVKEAGIPKKALDGCSGLSDGVYLREIAPRWFIFCQRDE